MLSITLCISTYSQPSSLERTLDDIRRLLRNCVHNTLGVRRRDEGDNAQVNYAELLGAVHLQFGVDHAAFVAREHRARRRGVVHGREVLLQPERDVFVGLHIRPGVHFATHNGLERLGLRHLAAEFDLLDVGETVYKTAVLVSAYVSVCRPV